MNTIELRFGKEDFLRLLGYIKELDAIKNSYEITDTRITTLMQWLEEQKKKNYE